MFSAKWYMDSAILHACHASHCRWGQAQFLLLNWDLTACWIISIHLGYFLVVDYKFSMSWHLGRFMHISCVNFHAYIGKWHCCPSEQEIKMFLQIELFASVVRALAFFDRPAAAWTVLRSVLLNVRSTWSWCVVRTYACCINTIALVVFLTQSTSEWQD